MGLSRREYAKRRGVTDKAVRKALLSRIAAALLPDDTIDADLADSLWEGNTKVSQRRGKEAERARASMAAASDPTSAPEPAAKVREDADRSAPGSAPVDNVVRMAEHLAANRAKQGPRHGPSTGDEPDQPATMMAVALENERERLRRVRRENDLAEGLLVPKALVMTHFFTVLRSVTSSWESWPDKVGAELAAQFEVEDTFTFTQALKDRVRKHLADLSASHDDVDAASRP